MSFREMSVSSRSTTDQHTVDSFMGSPNGRTNVNNPQLSTLAPSMRIGQHSPDNFTKELARLQEEQLAYMRKIDKEKARKESLESEYAETRSNLRLMMEKTRNGNIIKEFDVASKKQLGRMEYQLQMAKVKLSVSRNENAMLRKKVQDLRRDKLLHLQILNDLLKEASDGRKRLKYNQKELLNLNEKKHKTKVAIASIKNKMVKDMEDFSRELNVAKETISNTQTNLLTTIRDQTLLEYNSPIRNDRGEEAFSRTGGTAGTTADGLGDTAEMISNEQREIVVLLAEAGFQSLEELVIALERSEEQMFTLYNETQLKEEEMEKMDAENKHLEQQVEQQMSKLHALEGHHDKVKHELEQSIQALRTLIDKYEADYGKHLEVLNSITDNLMNLLRSIAIDEEPADQSLLSSGVTDRNVDDFLSLIEQRIDDLIQMSKAAQHQTIRRDDFLKIAPLDRHAIFHAPHLPSLHDGAGNDDEDDVVDETVKLQPISIAVLKDLMQKKLQAKERKRKNHRNLQQQLGVSPSQAGLRSRQPSAASLRSNDSGPSLISHMSK